MFFFCRIAFRLFIGEINSRPGRDTVHPRRQFKAGYFYSPPERPEGNFFLSVAVRAHVWQLAASRASVVYLSICAGRA